MGLVLSAKKRDAVREICPRQMSREDLSHEYGDSVWMTIGWKSVCGTGMLSAGGEESRGR